MWCIHRVNSRELEAVFMAEPSEKKALLALQNGLRLEWRDRTCHHEESVESGDSNDDQWWRESSCSSCSDSEYDGWPEVWNEEVTSKRELFYVECVSQNLPISADKWKKNAGLVGRDVSSSRSPRTWRKGAQGTLMRLVRRGSRPQRNSRKETSKLIMKKEDINYASKKSHSLQGSIEGRSANKVTFHDNQGGEIREVRVSVEPRKHNLGRRASLCETLLGLVPGHFSLEPPDDQRIMIAGFIPDTDATRLRKIKIGDWLHSIDGQEVSLQNVDSILATIATPCMATLTLQRVAGCDVTQHVAPYLLSKGLEVDQLLQLICRGAASNGGGSVVLLSTAAANQEATDEAGRLEEVLYCYPEIRQPPLIATRGLFLTLLQLIPEFNQSPPHISSLMLSGELLHIMYCQEEGNLILLAMPESSVSMLAAKDLFCYFMKAVKFSYQSFTRAAIEHKARLDLLVDSLFSQFAKILDGQCLNDVLPAAYLLPLPRETQTDLNNTLAQLEAADFSNQIKTHYNSQRLFTILGSCLLYKGLTVCSHLPRGLVAQLQAFCWLHGLSKLGREGPPLRRLLTWKQVYLSTSGEPDTSFSIPIGHHFILLLGQNHQILAILLESGGCTLTNEESLGPNIFYVEQAQATLDVFHRLGISEILETWLARKVDPEVQDSSLPSPSKVSSSKGSPATDQLMRNLRLNPVDQGGPLSKNAEGSLSASSLSHKSHKVTSILKQNKTSGRSSENSEDTCSQSASENRAASDTSSEDSWGGSPDTNDVLESTLEVYDGRLSHHGLPVPTQLVEGSPNCLLHYIHLETNLGVILAPDTKQDLSLILTNFRTTCLQVRSMLHQSEHDSSSRRWMNQSVVALTELGVLFECADHPDAAVYWVVGRHFHAPHPREVYVCYEDSISLNLVELAFRLALSANFFN